jgi:hypothetical protein
MKESVSEKEKKFALHRAVTEELQKNASKSASRKMIDRIIAIITFFAIIFSLRFIYSHKEFTSDDGELFRGTIFLVLCFGFVRSWWKHDYIWNGFYSLILFLLLLNQTKVLDKYEISTIPYHFFFLFLTETILFFYSLYTLFLYSKIKKNKKIEMGIIEEIRLKSLRVVLKKVSGISKRGISKIMKK